MPEYQYLAQTDSGAIERGRIFGPTPSDVREMLTRRERRLVSIQELKSPSSTGEGVFASLCNCRSQKIRSADVELVLQQLAVMLGSGLELTPSLRELSLWSPRPSMQKRCARLADAVEQGSSFEMALAEAPAFPAVVVQLVRVGEETGELPAMLQRAANFLEKRRAARGNLLAALSYPLFVALAACSVAAYLVGWAIPKLATFLHTMGRKLPAMTQSLLDASNVIQRYGPACAVLLAAGVVALVLVYAWKPGRYRIDKALLRLPLVGPLMQMAETQQLASALALMLRSGVLLQEALDTAAVLHRNRFLASRVSGFREQLAAGKDFSRLLSGHGFSPMLASMVAVGERTGELPKALEHIATFYAVELDNRLKKMAKLIEPAIIVVVGSLVGYVYIAFFMALLSAGGKFN